eukprot:TRINITY_DN673_c0_g1_i9.p1 TRINITY_DN673_c0_g1~~TRINITY_DN673_c0_g1_i9.p1  ORF type:complete len:327 (+),score=-30.56 TRINITY_DN673_c0_g1_i9:105-983(+)
MYAKLLLTIIRQHYIQQYNINHVAQHPPNLLFYYVDIFNFTNNIQKLAYRWQIKKRNGIVYSQYKQMLIGFSLLNKIKKIQQRYTLHLLFFLFYANVIFLSSQFYFSTNKYNISTQNQKSGQNMIRNLEYNQTQFCISTLLLKNLFKIKRKKFFFQLRRYSHQKTPFKQIQVISMQALPKKFIHLLYTCMYISIYMHAFLIRINIYFFIHSDLAPAIYSPLSIFYPIKIFQSNLQGIKKVLLKIMQKTIVKHAIQNYQHNTIIFYSLNNSLAFTKLHFIEIYIKIILFMFLN